MGQHAFVPPRTPQPSRARVRAVWDAETQARTFSGMGLCSCSSGGKRSAARNDYADDDDEETDEEEFHEAITPMGSLIGDVNGDAFLDRRSIGAKKPTDEETPTGPEEELMGAALLLCGLGRKVSRTVCL